MSVLALATMIMVVSPDVPFGVESLALDVIINDTALLVGIALAWLGFVRFRETGDVGSAAVAAAFTLSASFNLMKITLAATGADAEIGMSLDYPTQEPLYVHTAVRLVVAATLAVGGLGLVNGWRLRHPVPWLLAPLAIGTILATTVHVWWAAFPHWLDATAFEALTVQHPSGPLVGVAPWAVGLQMVIAGLFLSAALLFVRWRSHRSPLTGFLVVALVIAGMSEIHYALFPGSYRGIVSSNDVLRLLSATVLLFGLAADMRASSRALATAEAEVARLREAELAAVAVEERARLAREIHDGLSQHLWLAKLRLERLGTMSVPPGMHDAVAEVAALIDTGLAEAQDTVAALKSTQERGSLAMTVERHLEFVRKRTSVRIDSDIDEALSDLPPRVAAEVLRVIQEAVSNASRHADATRIGITAKRSSRRLRLEVRDNGVGFAPTSVATGFGLTSMRERIQGLGGTLRIDSVPQAGTTIRAEVPLDG